jgi:hypothetical protein
VGRGVGEGGEEEEERKRAAYIPWGRFEEAALGGYVRARDTRYSLFFSNPDETLLISTFWGVEWKGGRTAYRYGSSDVS